ncbi:MAG: hypothetical protein GPJ00_02030 [Microcystis aeruginosa W13-18]|nr:hypothetical protein [Microcystis aeruginosa W13-18]
MNDDFLVSLGLELYQEFQQWNYSLIDDWLNSIELLEKDLQPLARLHLNLEDLSEITDLFRDLDAWLTADFVPSLRSKDGKISSLERDSFPFDLGGNTSSFMSFSRQSLASTSDYTQTNLRVRTSNYLPLQKEQENSYNLRQKKQISFDDNHQANNIYPQNNAPKRWQELTDLVRDISGGNLPLDSDNLNSETNPWQNPQPKTESESNNPSPKRWQELTDLVRDISGGNLPLDSDNLNSETNPWQNPQPKTESESNNPSPKRWQELTDLVRDISAENLPLDSDNLNSETNPWQNPQPKTESESNNPSPKRWRELTDLVRDISGENLLVDSDNLNSETNPWQNPQPKTESESNNPSPKRWQELTNLVRDISGENLLVDSAIEADISSQLAEILPMPNPPQLLQQSRARVYHQSNNINSNYSSLQETELEINKQESENQNQSFDQQFSFQEIEEQSVDLDYIMESLERKINQEYRRFYGG